MTEARAKKKVLKFSWEPWLKRPFYGFIMSTFMGGNTKAMFKKIGLPGWECNFLLSNAEWYKSDSSYAATKKTILNWLKKHSATKISERLEASHREWIKEIKIMSRKPAAHTKKKLKRLEEILREITTYVWAVHAAEHHYTPLLRKAVAKIANGDVDKFIGDAAFPSKLNAAEQMVEEYKHGVKPKDLAKKYGWMRARDGFARPYTAQELEDFAKHALAQEKHSKPVIPAKLKKMFENAQELVYLRTLRSDIYYEVLYWAKPLLKHTAKQYHIPFSELKHYRLDSLIAGKPKRCPPDATWAMIGTTRYYFDHPIFNDSAAENITEVKGSIAQTGMARGTAKIVMSVKDLPKVKKGDVLVTYMTSPNFLPAMKLAAAFVTNEGGLTCHAAIVAREMKKPCVIGSKIATKIFKDGDMVEVDANKGVVKRL